MAKKGKVGKQRKDNYYKLAKQKGYRSRAAFKLIQLNKKFQFLENSRVCIDLCAAPGGWLQVASEFMPVSSVIIGVDLVPIAPIRNVLTFQLDITTKECTETIENNLANWKADIVLHDGAPNVGKSWLHDAYGQNLLVVEALKIACNHLCKGGWFITKIFRSADYNSLLWVFGKLFHKVHATKPQASRQESAEIFVVCQNYKKPEYIDPRFFDPSALFADMSDFDDTLKKQKADLFKPANKIKKAKAIGYDGQEILKTVSDVQFVTMNNHMEHLAQCHTIELNNPDITNHASTSEEIRECCKDLKVLGRKDYLKLLKWRREIRKDLTNKIQLAVKEGTFGERIEDDESHVDIETIPELQLDDIETLEDDEARRAEKKLKRKEEKRVKDYQQRVNYGMVNQNDILIEEEHDLFTLKTITGNDELDDAEPDEIIEISNNEDLENEPKKKVKFARDVKFFEDHEEDEEDTKDDSDEEEEADEPIVVPQKILKNKSANNALSRLELTNSGGLLTDLMDIKQSKITAASKFFDQDTFDGIDLEKELDTDLVDHIACRKPIDFNDSSPENSEDDDNYDSEMRDSTNQLQKKLPQRLNPEGLALASMIVSSDKVRKDIEDEGWNRYAHADSELAPKWFREEEAKHCRRNIPVRQEYVQEYKKRLREIDAKPIKKVLQAKNRQKRRALRKMDKLKKKVDAITTNEDLTQRDRINQIKAVYKNATKKKKREVKVVVARKGLPAKKPKHGKYKMVDSRLKKDLRSKERQKKGQKQKRDKGSKQRRKGIHKRKGSSK